MKRALSARDLGHFIRDTRKALGKTQQDIALGIGTRRQTIADLEAGRNVGMQIMFNALTFLGKGLAITDMRPSVDEITSLINDD